MHNYLRLCAMLHPEKLAIIVAVMYNVVLHKEPLKKVKTLALLCIVFIFVFTTPKMKAKSALIIHCLAFTEAQRFPGHKTC